MDVLTVDGKNYVKASVIARDLGYTADYVGQLCRGKKVDAKLFGRTWYVVKDSITGHKSTRYRSTQAKSIKAVHLVAKSDEKEDQVVHVANRAKESFYNHSKLKQRLIYTPDETPLFPDTSVHAKQKGALRVELADAEPIKVSLEEEAYTFNTPKLPTIKFKGSLSISEFESGSETADVELTEPKESSVLVHPKEVTTLSSEKVLKSIAISPKKTITKSAHTKKIIAEDLDGTVTTELILTETKTQNYTLSFLIAGVASLGLVFLLLGMEQHVFVTNEYSVSSYVFTIENVLASVISH